MDLKHPTTEITDPESETPLDTQSIKLLSNGKTNNHHHHHHPPPPTVVVAYRECLKNHAATIGGHALDGCGEFMPSLTCTPTEPISLKCAACGCHRNFHRRRSTNNDFSVTGSTHFIEFNRQTSTSTSPSPPSPPPPPQPTNYAYGPHLLLSLSTAADQNHTVATPGTPMPIKIDNAGGRKRFRTKFSQDQKEKMLVFAEKVGWKMQRCGDKMVTDFCNEIGIRRGIFKVWMHNNKNTLRKREKDITTTAATTTATTTTTATNPAAGVVRSNDSQENGSGDLHLQASTNGSSSSS